MPTTILVNDLIGIRVWCKDEEQASVNNLYFRAIAVTSNPRDQDVADYFDTNLAPNYKPLLSNVANYLGVEAQIFRPSPLTVFEPAIAAQFPGPGTGGPAAFPKQTSGLVSFRTAVSGRRNRGRNYIPFPSTAAGDSQGMPTAGYLTSLETLLTFYDAFIVPGDTIVAAGGTVTLVWTIRHRDLAFPLDSTPITTSVAKNAFATQRRRGSLGQANKAPF